MAGFPNPGFLSILVVEMLHHCAHTSSVRVSRTMRSDLPAMWLSVPLMSIDRVGEHAEAVWTGFFNCEFRTQATHSL